MSKKHMTAISDLGAALMAKQRSRETLDALNEQVDMAEAHFGMTCHLVEEAKAKLEQMAKEAVNV
jgi:hypothetical protein